MLGNLILETGAAPGVAVNVSLAGSPVGRRPFGSKFTNGQAAYYSITDGTIQEWGAGTYLTGSPNVLARTTVIGNSSGTTARLNFAGGVTVYNELPAERTPYFDAAGGLNGASFYGSGSFFGSGFQAAAVGGAVLMAKDTTAPADAKTYDFLSTGGGLYGRAVNDAYLASNNWLAVQRSGYVITSVTLEGTTINLTATDTVASGNVKVGGNVFVSRAALADQFQLWGSGIFRVFQFTTDNWNLQFAGGASGTLTYYTSSGTALFQSLGSNGDFHVSGNVVALNVSDERTKRDVTPYMRGLKDLASLRPVSYRFNGLGGTTDDGRLRHGLIAQEAAAYIPECVSETAKRPTDPTRDDVPPDPRLPGQLSLDEKPLLFALLNAVRELSERIEVLEARCVP